MSKALAPGWLVAPAILLCAGGVRPAAAATVAGGTRHTLVVKTPDGTLWAWGDNGSGQLGDGSRTSRGTPSPVSGLSRVVAVAAGARHSLALTSDGSVWAWGDDTRGQIGDGGGADRLLPVRVLTGARAIAAGDDHSVALKIDGSVWTWGANAHGQLGDGGPPSRSTPGPVTGLGLVSAIAAGADHTVAVLQSGLMKAWGRNSSGQLGDGSTGRATMPVLVAVVRDATTADGGFGFTLTRRSNGTLLAWGQNDNGQLGLGDTEQRLTAQALGGPSGVVGLAAGGYHALALLGDGRVAAWGHNSYGSVGDGSGVDQPSPVWVAGLPVVSSLGAGQYHSVAVSATGEVWVWGRNNQSQLGDGTRADRLSPTRIAEAGFRWKVATPTFSPAAGVYSANQGVKIKCDTSGATIRYTTDGTLPTGSSPAYSKPIAVSVSTTLVAKAFKSGLPDSTAATAVYTLKVATPSMTPTGGSYTTPQLVSLATTTTGATLRYTTDGSDPTTESATYTAPVPVGTTTTLKAAGFKSGWTTSDVATATYSFNYGTLAAPGFSPPPQGYLDSVQVTISAAAGATIRYTTDGSGPTLSSTLYTGPVGLLRTTTLMAKAWKTDYTPSPVTVGTYTLKVAPAILGLPSGAYPPGTRVSVTRATAGSNLRYTLTGVDPGPLDPEIASGDSLAVGNFTLRVRAFKDGCDASDVAAATYTLTVPPSVAPPVFAPAAGRYATRQAVTIASPTAGATVRYTTNGAQPTEGDPALALGQTVLVDRSLILAAKAWKTGFTPSGVRRGFYLVTGALAAGYTHLLALASDGRVWSWGSNSSGQLGDGTTTTRPTPAPVPGLSDVIAVAAGERHSLALRADGTVWAWGGNAQGQLGDGTHTSSLVPRLVPGLTGVARIAAGQSHSLAVRTDGSAWAWGDNAYGQLGDGSTVERASPVPIPGLGPVIALAGGAFHSLALRTDGTVWSWGQNGQGQLGDGTFVARPAPVRVVSLSGVSEIAAGATFSLALKTDGGRSGSVWVWGNGTQPTVSLDGATAIAAGNAHVLALRLDGTLWAWGEGGGLYGRLGDGARATRTSPVRVFGLRDAVAVAAGSYYSAAIRADGSVSTWGYNLPGTGSDTPSRVDGLSVAPNAWLSEDGDGDGLSAWDEWRYGTDPFDPDTNGDGIPDGLEVALGQGASNLDLDGDGLLNTEELALGTDPDRADTDGDGVPDGADCRPLDATQSTCSANPGDHTPPTITLLEPPHAIPLP